jgi:integrase
VRGNDDATFGACAARLIESLRPSWRSPLHAQQWQDTLTKEAARLAPMPVNTVTTEDVLAVLQPLWQTKPATAQRLRGRIERVLDAAKARGLIASPYENPARWRGHLDHLLPRRKLLEQPHHAALPYDDVPAIMRELRTREGIGARALELIILTAMRTNEVIGARWDEIDFKENTWTIPAARMKAGRTHRVPLSRGALAILKPLHEARESAFVFPGRTPGSALGRKVVRWQAEHMKIDGTVHGFRSSFRDWASETTSFPHEVCEAALAHTVGSAVERAYRRTDMFGSPGESAHVQR